jgi:hypothetical protein
VETHKGETMKLKKNQRLSKWQPGWVKPTIVGVYEREFIGGLSYSRWNGKKWLWSSYFGMPTTDEIRPSSTQDLNWRGIIED